MPRYFSVLEKVSLFQGIEPKDLSAMLACLKASTKEYFKDEILLAAGDAAETVGIVLEGRVQVVKEDINGGRAIIAALTTGDIFGEALCCARVGESPVSVVAATHCTVMLLPFFRITKTCSDACVFHAKLIENMIYLLAQKNLHLQKRMEIVSVHSLRDKLMKYFETYTDTRGQTFTVPLNREEMAEYLCADRSALSHELMKMKAEGLIEYRKNAFTLL